VEHADVGATIEMIKWFLALLCSVTSAFCGIMLWVGKKIDTVKCSINSLNDTVVAIKAEFAAKHADHSTEIAVLKTRVSQVDRRKEAI
jgi:hypothetical protein